MNTEAHASTWANKARTQRRRHLHEAIADNVRELRERHGLTQELFARRLKEHPQLKRTPRKFLLGEVRRAENEKGIAVSVLGYIGLTFGPSYKKGTYGSVKEAKALVDKIFKDAGRMERDDTERGARGEVSAAGRLTAGAQSSTKQHGKNYGMALQTSRRREDRSATSNE